MHIFNPCKKHIQMFKTVGGKDIRGVDFTKYPLPIQYDSILVKNDVKKAKKSEKILLDEHEKNHMHLFTAGRKRLQSFKTIGAKV